MFSVPQVIILLVLLVSWMDDPSPEIAKPKQDIQVIEYFAGCGRIAYMAERVGYQSVGYDLDYGKKKCLEEWEAQPLGFKQQCWFCPSHQIDF